MEIKIATLNDIEALCPLIIEFFAYNAQLSPVYSFAAIERGDYPKMIIESENSDFLIAIRDDDIIGFIHINQMKTPPYDAIVQYDYAEIMAFMVRVQSRVQGVGTLLIESAKEWSKKRNLKYIELVSLKNAKEANIFYDKKDFTVESYIRRFIL